MLHTTTLLSIQKYPRSKIKRKNTRIINNDQVRFISELSEWFNVGKHISIIEKSIGQRIKNFMISLIDAKKVLGNQHPFQIKILK